MKSLLCRKGPFGKAKIPITPSELEKPVIGAFRLRPRQLQPEGIRDLVVHFSSHDDRAHGGQINFIAPSQGVGTFQDQIDNLG